MTKLFQVKGLTNLDWKQHYDHLFTNEDARSINFSISNSTSATLHLSHTVPYFGALIKSIIQLETVQTKYIHVLGDFTRVSESSASHDGAGTF